MAELKPCPFCGGEAFVDYALTDYNFWGVACKRCGAYVGVKYAEEDTRENAIAAWNRRAGDGK